MPPQGLSEFDPPRTTVFTGLGAALTILAQQSPTRVVLMIACPGGTAVISPNSNVAGVGGYPLSSTQSPFCVTWAGHGPLVSVPWYCIGGGAATVIVSEVFYKPTDQVDDAKRMADWLRSLKTKDREKWLAQLTPTNRP